MRCSVSGGRLTTTDIYDPTIKFSSPTDRTLPSRPRIRPTSSSPGTTLQSSTILRARAFSSVARSASISAFLSVLRFAHGAGVITGSTGAATRYSLTTRDGAGAGTTATPTSIPTRGFVITALDRQRDPEAMPVRLNRMNFAPVILRSAERGRAVTPREEDHRHDDRHEERHEDRDRR